MTHSAPLRCWACIPRWFTPARPLAQGQSQASSMAVSTDIIPDQNRRAAFDHDRLSERQEERPPTQVPFLNPRQAGWLRQCTSSAGKDARQGIVVQQSATETSRRSRPPISPRW